MGVDRERRAGEIRGLVAHVPFVDIVTTMLDESIPLTTLEYDEWGDPHERAVLRLHACPIRRTTMCARRRIPPLLVTTGLWDSQVQYYEPAKWVAKLRALEHRQPAAAAARNLEAGHGGKSGRFERLREVAREYGFVIAARRSIATWPSVHS